MLFSSVTEEDELRERPGRVVFIFLNSGLLGDTMLTWHCTGKNGMAKYSGSGNHGECRVRGFGGRPWRTN